MQGTTIPAATPRVAPPQCNPWAPSVPALPDAVSLAPGRDHQCALLATGRVACWGANLYGQLGSGELGLVAAPAL